MKANKKSPVGPVYNTLGIAGALLFVLSFFISGATTDFHFHDTYVVIATSHILLLLGCYFLFLWILYQRLRNRSTSPALTTIHVIMTLTSLLALFVVSIFRTRNYVDYSTFQQYGQAVSLLTLLFLLAQLLFLLNGFIAAFRRKRNG